MSRFKVGDRVFVNIFTNWDETDGEPFDPMNIYGWSGVVTHVWDSFGHRGYGVLLENDPWHMAAWFDEDELASLDEYNAWVGDVIADRRVPEQAIYGREA